LEHQTAERGIRSKRRFRGGQRAGQLSGTGKAFGAEYLADHVVEWLTRIVERQAKG
jgi:hypothetical protein